MRRRRDEHEREHRDGRDHSATEPGQHPHAAWRPVRPFGPSRSALHHLAPRLRPIVSQAARCVLCDARHVADADRAIETAAALRSWLEHEYGGTVLDAEAPRSIGTGFSTLIDYVRFAGRDLPPEWTGALVARTHKTVEEAAVARAQRRVRRGRPGAASDRCVRSR